MAYQNYEIQLSRKFTALIAILEKKTELEGTIEQTDNRR